MSVNINVYYAEGVISFLDMVCHFLNVLLVCQINIKVNI